jgi:glycosyltransferase involved in cell wall biosynthesis
VYKLVALSRDEGRGEGMSGDGVSVIITAHNCASVLRENLVGFLMQDHEAYEVIVVDDCSEDETGEILSRLQEEYPRLKYTRIHPDTKFRFTKKLAINIGILSARHEILLFSEANCYPASPSWVRAMHACFNDDTAVVIGPSNFPAENRSFAWRRYFRFTRFLEIMLLARTRKSVLGDGCNMAYRKSLYMRNRGFAGNTQSFLGYDHDMVRDLSRYGRVRVVCSPESLVHVNRTERDVNDSAYYFASKAKWPFLLRLQTGTDTIARVCIYGLSLLLICLGIFPLHVLLLVATLFLVDVVCASVFARRFQQRKLFLTSCVANAVGFAYRWYWSGYSLFNPKKWR